MRHSVDRSLHAACAAGLQRFARIIQPDITSLNEKAGDVQVVVIDECNATCELRIRSTAINSFEAALAGFIRRVGFASKDQLNGSAQSIQEARESILVVEDQI